MALDFARRSSQGSGNAHTNTHGQIPDEIRQLSVRTMSFFRLWFIANRLRNRLFARQLPAIHEPENGLVVSGLRSQQQCP